MVPRALAAVLLLVAAAPARGGSFANFESGHVRPLALSPGGGGGSPPFALTTCSVIAVVRLPESSTAAYTTEPSELAASARGASPKSCTIASGASPAPSASNTHTSARPTPGAVSCGPPAGSAAKRFCPRRAAVTKARAWPLPAKTMSRGSSPTRSVRATRERVTSDGSISTTLTLSER